ncbi:hypothetical protein N7447_000086 [Penicillium robsamsonii]|uniref:uncharacterized protein n=1 Tax=Penicillium robsamsonii TaxID=1792511 RepID=UPI002548E72E|nr:uncharacterized protein N7447_000086 [Penicillium robsamsonii]KAJ5834060.1 hypothetical protein N7447_000086 [Penicillium robsamsonii]
MTFDWKLERDLIKLNLRKRPSQANFQRCLLDRTTEWELPRSWPKGMKTVHDSPLIAGWS